jgi:hypothetical protein
MIKIEIDPGQNLFVMRYSDTIAADEVEKALGEIRQTLQKLRAGFTLFGDFTKLQRMDSACAPFIEQAMDLFNASGVSRIVRVIPDPHRDIGMGIMSIFHYRGDIQILTCETLEQAEPLLRTP